MDYNNFNKTYYRASYEWNVSEYVKTDMLLLFHRKKC